MIIHVICFVYVLSVCLVMSFVQAYPLNEAIEKLDQQIQTQLKRGKIPGCAVAIVDKGTIVFIKAYGVRKKGDKTPIDLETVFQLGSISKPITATLIAILQKQGVLNVETRVKKLLPFVNSKTRLKHILGHTTGYASVGWNQKIEKHIPRELLLREISESQQALPGQVFSYHNLVYSLTEIIIANVFQQPFARVVDTKVFQPLGMKQATVGYQDFVTQQNRAWPHQFNKKKQLQNCSQYSHSYHDSVCSAGGMNASIQDMAAFLAAQIQGVPGVLTTDDLALFHTSLIEAPDAKEWMKETLPGDFKSYYGLGWRIIEMLQDRIVFHGGYLNGFTNFLGFSPRRKVGIVILHNGQSIFAAKTAMWFLTTTN